MSDMSCDGRILFWPGAGADLMPIITCLGWRHRGLTHHTLIKSLSVHRTPSTATGKYVRLSDNVLADLANCDGV